MKIDMTNWKLFQVGDLFHVINGKGVTTEEIESYPGDLEAVQSGEGNNGVMGHIDKAYCDSKGYLYCEEPCLTVARSGTSGFVSFHQNGCVAGDSAKILLLKDSWARTFQVYLFMQTLLSANRFKYTYGRKVTESLYKRTAVKLPVSSAGTPDWQWMELYIDSLHSEPLRTGNAGKATLTAFEFDICEWRVFRVEDLFDSIYKVPSYDCNELERIDAWGDAAIPYVTRTDLDNGVKSFVLGARLANIEAGNAIVIGDTTSTISYQSGPFVAGEHIVAARADWMNKYTGLFITCLLRQERYRYSYGRAYKLDSIRNTELRLPVASDGMPDWQWMEAYIKLLPYGDRLE